MPYCTVDDLTARYGQALLVQISDRADAPTGEVDLDLVNAAIANADALIDGYLLGRYALPLESVPALVKDWSLRVAIYYAHGQVVDQKIADDYAAALKQLSQVASGAIRLNIAGAEPATSGATGVEATDTERVITPDSMRGYI
jgi:phage gp36-like protein